jgi:hypothetical protein
MIVGLVLLRPGFVGRARAWWTVALVIQFWHHIEHLLLLIQAQTHVFFFGATVPTSVAQTVFSPGRHRGRRDRRPDRRGQPATAMATDGEGRTSRRELACGSGLNRISRSLSGPWT